MTSEATAYVTVVVAWCVGALLLTARARRRSITSERRYRMFALRDRLFMLVAQGVVKEEDPVYRTACGLVNGMIRGISDGDLRAFARDFLAAERTAISDKSHQDAVAFVEAARRAPEPLQKVLEEFLDSVIVLLLEASVLLRVVVAHLLPRLRRRNRRVYKPVVYRAYIHAVELGRRLGQHPERSILTRV